uniref:tRNA (adenine(58)-N(1))-methyltransferase non-catalytic subunit TRM6 n=1 Tax=Panagrellus redivivus TaxID=6233 RepID=A0A7E4WBE7_PANRE
MSRKRRISDDEEGPPVKMFEYMPRSESTTVDCECGVPNSQHLLPPTPSSSRKIDVSDLSEIVHRYIRDERDRIGYMTLETLERIVQYSNAQPGARVFVYEETLGLITMSVAFKMGSVGELTVLHNGMNPATFPVLQEVGGLWDFKTLILVRISSVAHIERKNNSSSRVDMGMESDSDCFMMDCNDGQTTSESPTISWDRGVFLQNTTLDCAIIVANLFKPAEILAEAFLKLGPGGRIIVYSTSKEKIEDVHAFLVAHDVHDLNIYNQQDFTNGPITGYLVTAFKP